MTKPIYIVIVFLSLYGFMTCEVARSNELTEHDPDLKNLIIKGYLCSLEQMVSNANIGTPKIVAAYRMIEKGAMNISDTILFKKDDGKWDIYMRTGANGNLYINSYPLPVFENKFGKGNANSLITALESNSDMRPVKVDASTTFDDGIVALYAVWKDNKVESIYERSNKGITDPRLADIFLKKKEIWNATRK